MINVFNKFTQSYGHTPMANLKKMNDMQLSKIIDYAKTLGYSDVELTERRDDGDIYLLTHGEDRHIEGMPQYIIVTNDNITVMSPENALSCFMDIKSIIISIKLGKSHMRRNVLRYNT